MVDAKKKPGVASEEKIDELNDAQLDEVNGGIGIPTISDNEKFGGLKLGQAVKKPSCFPNSGGRFK